jgi:glutamine amidotransferase
MNTAIIKYNAGNIQSVLFALERLGAPALVTDDPKLIREADKVIFPGVGEASSAMQYLRDRKLDEVIRSLTQPVLGICLGMQLMCMHSDEGDTTCLGIFETQVKKFDHGLKTPQMGWNQVKQTQPELFSGFDQDPYFYFVHSYYAGLCAETAATTDYGLTFSSGLQKGNFYGVQFHPEKSAEAGQLLLENFLKL